MKKIFYFLLCLLIILGCSKSENTPTPTPVTDICPKILTFNVSQQTDILAFTLTNNNIALLYEVSFLNSANGTTNPDNGQTFTFNSLTFNKEINSLSISPNNTYLFYARAVCSDGTKSAWSTPVSLLIINYCDKPTNLRFELDTLATSRFAWDNSSGATYYQVQYGAQNFVLGTGTITQVNNTYYNGMSMAANTTYDFYVRSFCTNAIGWSSWSGPYTRLSVGNQNLCSLPLNLAYTIESTNSSTAFVSLQWAWNGETNFEYTVVGNGQSPTTGSILTANTSGWPTIYRPRFYTYNFYIRAVCSNGSRTAWAGPKNIIL